MYTGRTIIIFGATATGKTAFAESLAGYLPIEIINMDSAQMYTACTIGTAKPDWRHSTIAQHMFDCIDTPVAMTTHAYTQQVVTLVHEIKKRGNIPVIVGGSGFYLKSLVYPQQSLAAINNNYCPPNPDILTADLWRSLAVIDPIRAQEIHPHDRYRIMRALEIWHTTGCKPSVYKPLYAPAFDYTLVHVYRQKPVLHAAIEQRVGVMLEQGWLEEVRRLRGTPWQHFVRQKGFIGYTELDQYIDGNKSFDEAVHAIIVQTKQYAKRQETFWRMVYASIAQDDQQQLVHCLEFDLTNMAYELYIKQLLNDLKTL